MTSVDVNDSPYEKICCRRLCRAFHFACSIRNLDYFDSCHEWLLPLIRSFVSFAEERELTLLILLDHFPIVDNFGFLFEHIIFGFRFTRKPHTLVVGSSTSHPSKRIFAPYANEQDSMTDSETKALVGISRSEGVLGT